MTSKTIRFTVDQQHSTPAETPCIIVGHLNLLRNAISFDSVKNKLGGLVSAEVFKDAVSLLQPSSAPDCVPLYLNRAVVAALPTKCSRHNSPAHPLALYNLLKSWDPPKSSGQAVDEKHIVIVCFPQDVFALGCATSRAFPLYSAKTGSVFATKNVRDENNLLPATPTKDMKRDDKESRVVVEFVIIPNPSAPPEFGSEAFLSRESMEALGNLAESIRMAARIVDAPPNEMHTTAFVKEAQRVAADTGAEIVILKGEELVQKGMHALYGVGKASVEPPYLVVLSHRPSAPEGKTQKKIAWVGKGICFDTGGLCIKTPKTVMCGMKRDCGGAAAVLAAFHAAVRTGFDDELHAVLCLAENSVSKESTRPDDIHYSYSGKSIEINNTDAEGRLVLADGVTYAQKDLRAEIIVDIATLTGAQGIATGRHHAGILTNNEHWENYAAKIGKITGDLTFPMVFAPELHFSEFKSAVADMKNSVANRDNATASCAGLFILAHLGFDWPGVWLHVDMAAPVHCGERATGYGVALLVGLFSSSSSNGMIKNLATLADGWEKIERGQSTCSYSAPLTRDAGINIPQ